MLLLAREMGVLQLGTVALDGTKIHANASRHSALSYQHAGQIEAQLRAEVAALLAKAEAADGALEALGPAPASQGFAAGIFGTVVPFELGFAEPFLELH